MERTGGTKGDVDFIVMLGSSEASAGDFVGVAALPLAISGTILDGDSETFVTVEVAGDTLFEPDEHFTLTIASAVTANGIATEINEGGDLATGIILDNDFQIVETGGTNKNDTFTDAARTAATYRAGNGDDVARGGGKDLGLDFDYAEGDRLLVLDGMRLVGLREVNTDSLPGNDATELQFNGATVSLSGVTGVHNPSDLYAIA